MALSLVESMKLGGGTVERDAVIETIGTHSPLLAIIPFETIPGAAYAYNQEEALPGVAFRGVNASFTESTGVINPQVETLNILGGDLDVDKFIVRTQGEGVRTTHEMMKVKAIALEWLRTFIRGDSAANAAEPDGLQARLTGGQVISNNSASGGGALSLEQLDALIDQTDSPTHLLMNRAMKRRLQAAARNHSIQGIDYRPNEFGYRTLVYNDLQIIEIDESGDRTQILPFSEAASGGGAASCTSIYCISLADGQLMGIQNSEMEVDDLGELDTAPVYRTRLEWYMSFALLGDRSAARLRDITNAAVTA